MYRSDEKDLGRMIASFPSLLGQLKTGVRAELKRVRVPGQRRWTL